MELPVGEMQQRLQEAIAAAARGEAVLLTHEGEAIAEFRPLPVRKKFDWDAMVAHSRSMGWDKYRDDELWPPEFDDPAYSRKVLGLE